MVSAFFVTLVTVATVFAYSEAVTECESRLRDARRDSKVHILANHIAEGYEQVVAGGVNVYEILRNMFSGEGNVTPEELEKKRNLALETERSYYSLFQASVFMYAFMGLAHGEAEKVLKLHYANGTQESIQKSYKFQKKQFKIARTKLTLSKTLFNELIETVDQQKENVEKLLSQAKLQEVNPADESSNNQELSNLNQKIQDTLNSLEHHARSDRRPETQIGGENATAVQAFISAIDAMVDRYQTNINRLKQLREKMESILNRILEKQQRIQLLENCLKNINALRQELQLTAKYLKDLVVMVPKSRNVEEFLDREVHSIHSMAFAFQGQEVFHAIRESTQRVIPKMSSVSYGPSSDLESILKEMRDFNAAEIKAVNRKLSREKASADKQLKDVLESCQQPDSTH